MSQTPQSQFQSLEPQPFGAQGNQFNTPQNNDPIYINGGEAPKSNKKTIIFLLIALLIIGVVAAVILIPMLLPSSNSGPSQGNQNDNQSSNADDKQDKTISFTNPTLREIEDYCIEQKMDILLESYPSDSYSRIVCSDGPLEHETLTPNVIIGAVLYDLTNKNIATNVEESISSLEVIKKNESYTKYHGTTEKTISSLPANYTIAADGFALYVMCENERLARSTLIDLGYPDQDWYEGASSDDSGNSSSANNTKVEQRNTTRRNDMSRVDTSLVQYQTNHSNQSNNLPNVDTPAIWQAPADGSFSNDCSSNVACAFVRDYMNTASSTGTNAFNDPDGTLYNLIITPDWAENGVSITGAQLGNSSLSKSSQGIITIVDGPDGSAFDEHVIYIVPGAKCDGEGVATSTKNHFAILYRLEGDTVKNYCICDQ